MSKFNLDDYITVNERLIKFYEKYPEGSIQTEIISNIEDIIIFKAYAYKNSEDTKPATGHAMEKEGNTFINKTSHVENCETSAVGRALAMLGFEIKKAICSKEEVENARNNQDNADKPEPSALEKRAAAIYYKMCGEKVGQHNMSKKAYGDWLQQFAVDKTISTRYGKKWTENDVAFLENAVMNYGQQEYDPLDGSQELPF